MNKELLQEMISTLLDGGEFKYEDENIKINVNSNGIFISSNTMQKSTKDKEIELFLDFCDKIDDDVFIKACETFKPEDLAKLDKDLNTDNYKNTIVTFTKAVKNVAKSELEKFLKTADVEIRKHEQIISESQKAINAIYSDLDYVQNKYASYVKL